MAQVNRWKKLGLIVGASIIIVLVMVNFIKPPQQTPAPNFTLNSLRGETLSLSNFRGKIVVLEFMATWCTYCAEEISHIKELTSEYSANDVVIIMISIDPVFDTPETLQQFVEKYEITSFVTRDTVNVTHDYGVLAVPTLVLIDANGYIRARFEGVTVAATLSKEIDRLLSEE